MPSPRVSMRSRFAMLRRQRMLALALAALVVPVVLLVVIAAVTGPALDAVERIPVAVVNLDKGAKDAKGRAVSYGEDLVDSLQQTGDLAWAVVDEGKADAGITDGTYALALKVPKDYSKKVASLSGDEPEKAMVEIVSDGSGNVLATRAGAAALRQVQSRLKSTLGEDYLLSVLNDVRGQATRLSVTADGSVMLDAGYDALKQGAGAISTGLSQTVAAAGQLTGGLGQIAGGVTAAGTGAGALAQGITAVQQQAAAPLAQGAGAFAAGLDQIATTAQAMGQGLSGIGTALGTLQQTLASANGDLAGLMGMGGELAQQGEVLHGASTSLEQALKDAEGPMGSLVSVAATASPALKQASADTSALAASISSDQSDSLKTQVSQLSATLTALKSARDQMAAALSSASKQVMDASDADAPTAGSDAEQVALAAINAQINALEQQAAALSRQTDASIEGSISQKAASAATSVDAAAQSVSAAGENAAALKNLSDALASSGKTATGALASMGQTAANQQQAIKNIAGALMGGQAILKGTNPTTGESYDLAATASGLGQGVSALGTQLSGEGAVGKGASGIATGTQALSAALTPMATGAGQLAQGNTALGTALGAVAQGAGGLGQGLSAMASASGQLGAGVDQLKDASGKISETMDKAGDALTDVASAREERAQVASNPVTFTSTSRHAVDGTASVAAPVAIAVALWVGALLASFVLSAINMRAAVCGRGVMSTLSHAGAYMLFGLFQALLIGVVALALGVQLGDAVLTAALMALGAVSFAALAQFIRLVCGRLAGAVSVILLVLQLLCAGAILPTSFTGGAFTALGSILPLPILAETLRGVIAGSNAGLHAGMTALAVWTVVALVASLLVASRRRTVRPERLLVQ